MPLSYLEWLLTGALIVLVFALVWLFRMLRQLQQESLAQREMADLAQQSLLVHEKLLDVTPTLIVALDALHQYVTVNRAFEDAIGLTRQQLAGTKAGALQGAAGELGAQLEAFAARCALKGEAISDVIRLRSAAGREIDGLLVMQPYQEPGSQNSGTMAAVIDITARLAAERDAAQIKSLVEDIVESLPIAFAILRQEPGGHRWFPYVVGRTEQFSPWSRPEFQQNAGGIFPNILEASRETGRQVFDQSIVDLAPVQMDIQIERKNDVGWVRVGTGVPRSQSNGALLWNSYWADVTVEHQQSEALEAAKQAAEANAQAKSRFLATMSHEIRTPLATTVGALELLRDTKLESGQREHLELADSSARLLLEILGDILDFSRLESGERSVESVPFDLRELLDQVTHIFSAQVQAKGMTLDVHVDPQIAITLVSDPISIKQIVLNLLGNAVKFTEHGSICVQARLESEEDASEQQRISISVSDTGIGIAPTAQATLFQAFHQADTSTARRFGGSGLGLTVCQRLASLLGGSISVHSDEGQGSVFDVKLTLKVANSPSPLPQELVGKSIDIALSRSQDATAVRAYALALGMVPRDDHSSADLRVVDSRRWQGKTSSPSIFLRRDTEVVDIGQAQPLHADPIGWLEFRRACLAVLVPPMAEQSHADTINQSVSHSPALPILVVEDHHPYQLILQKFLGKLDRQAIVVPDGQEALRTLEEHTFAMVITDCHMPRMDGFELARRIRSHTSSALREIPIIALSADVSADQLQRCHDAGMNDYLGKPVTLETLKQCVEKWLR